jgi:TRAP-type mannitol/chloroaromatic compound transport system permease small subunit
MGSLLAGAQVLDTIARSIGKKIGWIILPLIAVIMFDVITRKIDVTRIYFSGFTMEYGISVSTILQDLQWHFHGALLMLTFGFGYLSNAHVRVDVFRELFRHKAQAWLEFWGLIILAIPFLVLMINYSIDITVLSFNQGEGSESMTGLGQRWFIKSAMIVGFAITLMAVIATLVRLIGFLFGSEEDKESARHSLEIFADEARELEAARLEAERALQAEKGN